VVQPTTQPGERDLAAKRRRDRRKLLLGTVAGGSVMLTLPARRALASNGASHSAWTSFCQNPSSSVSKAVGYCGDSPSTWQKYCSGNYNQNDVPYGWAFILQLPFELLFGQPDGYDCYPVASGSKPLGRSPTLQECIFGMVVYRKKGKPDLTYPQQATCSFFNALYYTIPGGQSYYWGLRDYDVCADFQSCNSTATHDNLVRTKYAPKNVN